MSVRDLDGIYRAIMEARHLKNKLQNFARRPDDWDELRNSEHTIACGLEAYERLSRDLREGRKYVEPSQDYRPTGCSCHLGGAPCSWCTRSLENDDEVAASPALAQKGTSDE